MKTKVRAQFNCAPPLAILFAVFVACASFVIQTPRVSADGLIVVDCAAIPLPPGTVIPMPAPGIWPPVTPRPPVRRDCSTYLAVKNHNVTVTIDNQIARTRVDQTFLNDSTYALEGTYIFPLPEDAAISDFSMWVDGKKLEGRVLDKNEARQIYESIVRSQRDPALLEYVGRNAFQARIFPIPPQSEKRVEIEYSQIIKADSSTSLGSAQNGLVRYVYPLNTEKFSPKPLKNVSVTVSVKSSAAIKAIYSPSHNVSVTRSGDYAAKVGYEDANVRPDRDFVLYYSVTQDDIGLNLISYKQGSEDGFFVMLVAPKVAVDTRQVIAKDVILVLDVSGSMQGAKIDQAKRALGYILDQLNPNDRFNIETFSTSTNWYASSLRPASSREDARNYVSRIRAEGSTDINRALLEAMGMVDPSTSLRAERPTIIIFLTDGLPTTGETNATKILSNVTNATPKNVRLFNFGVGDDVNTILLDSLSDKLRGASGYVRPNEKIDEIVSAFYAKVSTPVLSDLTIDWGGITVNDVYPYPLPDLFAGTQLIVTGRYRNSGAASITLKGNVNNAPQSFRYSDVTFRSSGGDDSIPRLWATRKIGYLLNEIRLRGESREIVNEIVALAVRYGIVTPYTSFLVDERQDVFTQTGRNRAATEAGKALAPAAMPTSGAAAVQQSQDQNALRGALAAPTAAPMATRAPAPGMSAQPQVETSVIQTIGDKTFLLRDNVWMDTQFDPSKMTTKKIEFGSDAYFALTANNPEWGKYLALGSRVIVVVNGVAYEITDTGVGATDARAAPTSLPLATPVRGEVGAGSTPTPIEYARLATPVAPSKSPDLLPTAMPQNDPNTRLLIGGGLLGAGLLITAGVIAYIALRK
ncbi:MAG: VIT domain-containing protein [Chloroflexota bacterium]